MRYGDNSPRFCQDKFVPVIRKYFPVSENGIGSAAASGVAARLDSLVLAGFRGATHG